MNNRKMYPDDNFNDKVYESLFGNKLNKDIFKKKKLTEGKKRLTEAPWVWKDDDEVEDDDIIRNDTQENSVNIEQAAREIVDIMFNDKDFREEQSEWIKGKGFSSGDPFLAACKYFRDYCEMPEEDDALMEFVDDYEDEHDCDLDDDIYELIVQYLGEKACEEYGAQAYFDILMRPSDFYDLGE